MGRSSCRSGSLAEQADLQVVDAVAELLIVHRLEDIVGDLEPQRFAAESFKLFKKDEQ